MKSACIYGSALIALRRAHDMKTANFTCVLVTIRSGRGVRDRSRGRAHRSRR
jgi:hypothetical protein